MTDEVKAKTARIGRKILPVLKKHDVVKAGIFGSFVRGEERAGSDIDILVDFKETKSLFEFLDLQFELEKKLGKKVDLVTYSGLNKYIKDDVFKEEISVL